MSKSIEVSAKTQEEAISQGLEQLGVSIGDVTVELLQEGSKGLFGFFGSRLAKVKLTLKDDKADAGDAHQMVADLFREEPVVRKAEKAEKPEKAAAEQENVTSVKPQPKAPKNPEKAPEEKKKEAAPAEKPKKAAPKAEKKPAPQEEKPAAPIEPAPQADPETAAGKAQQFLQEVTKLMGVEVSVAVSTDEEGNVKVDMEGDTLGILIGRRGETLDALQYLTSLQVNRGQSEYTRVTLDTEHYRAKREEALIRLANRMANRAQKTGRRVSMEPMNPYERRILHSALQENEAVTTHSEGEEPNRHVVIVPNKKNGKAPEKTEE